MRTSENGVKLIKKYESLRLNAYRNHAGDWAIGYGHTQGVMRGDRTNETGATEMLKEDLLVAEKAVNAVRAELNQDQFDALVSLAQSIGVSAFRKYWQEPVQQNPGSRELYERFMSWMKVTDPDTGEKVELEALKQRRQEEAEMYFS